MNRELKTQVAVVAIWLGVAVFVLATYGGSEIPRIVSAFGI
jgi:hypothetical protein